MATVALRLRDPHVSGSWGFCPSALLGFYCPGCGGLRAVNDLTHGDLAAAASSNLLLVAVAPLAIAALVWWTGARWRDRPLRLPAGTARPAAYLGLAVVVVFTLLRNLPGSWLAP